MKLDRWDTWNTDETLAIIILPLLKQMKATKLGAPFTDDGGVPEGIGLRSSESPPKEDDSDIDEYFFKRWGWIIDEMIWNFEQIQPDYFWEDQYSSGEIEFVTEKLENGQYKLEKVQTIPISEMMKGSRRIAFAWKTGSDCLENIIYIFGVKYGG